MPGFMDDEKARSEFGFDVIIECLVVDYLGIVVGVGHLVEEDVVIVGYMDDGKGLGGIVGVHIAHYLGCFVVKSCHWCSSFAWQF